ncbi:MAG: T9SS type A sorting domain-containing protein [Edaphocola sp.]
MERLDFLKKGVGFLGMAVLGPSLLGIKRAAACTQANPETEGPFPTLTPASLVRSNIVGNRTGVAFTMNIYIKNINDSCNALSGALVDVWHCDKDGNYSQYGGTSLQTADYTSEDFLRGRQASDSNGLVSFTSIFPSWYDSRATHIHMHIYDSSGNSLLVTQIAFPEGTGSVVETVNAATSYGYTKGMTGYTYNADDNVFTDGTATQMSTITGSLSAGYVLSYDCYVSGPTATGISQSESEKRFQIRQNYPNPCTNYTKIPLTLAAYADVVVVVAGTDGRVLGRQVLGTMAAGEHSVDLDVSTLAAGVYVYTVKVTTADGIFSQSKLFQKE